MPVQLVVLKTRSWCHLRDKV